MTTYTEQQPARPAGSLAGRVVTVAGGTCGIGAVHGGRDT